jgi:hypothetical protein
VVRPSCLGQVRWFGNTTLTRAIYEFGVSQSTLRCLKSCGKPTSNSKLTRAIANGHVARRSQLARALSSASSLVPSQGGRRLRHIRWWAVAIFVALAPCTAPPSPRPLVPLHGAAVVFVAARSRPRVPGCRDLYWRVERSIWCMRWRRRRGRIRRPALRRPHRR